MVDEEPTPEERRAAAELARALERGTGSPPEDALEAASLLRYARSGGELPADRRDAILNEVLATARAPEAPVTLFRRFRWAVGAAVAACAALLLFIAARDRVTGDQMAALPEPPAALLQAQVAVAGGAEPRKRLDDEMKSYRVSMYAALGAGER
jgi:hypothetical protein